MVSNGESASAADDAAARTPRGAMNNNNNNSTTRSNNKLAEKYPVNTSWELTLAASDDGNGQEIVSGTIYCVDEMSQSIVLQKALAHTTLASEVRIVNANAIVKASRINNNEKEENAKPLFSPLPKIQKKTLEDRERKALKLAEESFRHINQKATPEGQACFDRLLKACNEVVWNNQEGECCSILVLNQIQVDPPYTPETCKIVQRNPSGAGRKALDGSLDRVRKIVAAAAAAAAAATTTASNQNGTASS